MSATFPTPQRDLSWDWRTVLGHLEVELPAAAYDTWLDGSRAIGIDEGTLLVAPRSAFLCDWLNERMARTVERTIAEVLKEELAVRFVWPSALPGEATPRCSGSGDITSTRAPLVGSVNARFTFERYLQAEGNEFAYQACARLLDPGALPMTPVFVYGSPGVGKTHLLHAAAARAAAAGWGVACLSAEQFTNRYVHARKQERLAVFKAELRSVGLLVVDDLQYLAGRESTTEELGLTIDEISNAGGKVVLASEVPPYEMSLPQRLVSRLMAGVTALIEPFGIDERRAFIEWLAREQRVALPVWAIERIAGCEVPSVRVLQGAVNAAVLLQQSGKLDLRRLDASLMHLTAVAVAPPSLGDKELVERIAKHFQVTFEELVGRSRSGSVGEARAVAAAALHNRGRSFAQVGAMLSGRDASTVKGICQRGLVLIDSDPLLRSQYAA